eukprot:2197884-Rhodomonas_salina.1
MSMRTGDARVELARPFFHSLAIALSPPHLLAPVGPPSFSSLNTSRPSLLSIEGSRVTASQAGRRSCGRYACFRVYANSELSGSGLEAVSPRPLGFFGSDNDEHWSRAWMSLR